MNFARPESQDRFPMRYGSIALVNLETIFGKTLCQALHFMITAHFRRNTGNRDRKGLTVPLNDSLVRVGEGLQRPTINNTAD